MKLILSQRSLLRISGSDSEMFLQNQLSNDIKKLENSKIQFNAFCQHQGKIVALFWVMRSNGSFLLSCPDNLAEKVITRLQMFIIMSDVVIEDISEQYNQIGLINESHSNAYSINKALSLLIVSSGEVIEEINDNDYEWKKACIDFQIPEVVIGTSEKFVPQMLNLDIDEVGVSFSKGCYPGQEVVARLHYLGEAKRRLFSFKSESEMQVGDNLYCASSNTAKARGTRYKGSGIVVSKVKYNSLFYGLATLDTDLKDNKITLNNEHGPILEILNNE
jgi:hypothetical protein